MHGSRAYRQCATIAVKVSLLVHSDDDSRSQTAGTQPISVIRTLQPSPYLPRSPITNGAVSFFVEDRLPLPLPLLGSSDPQGQQPAVPHLPTGSVQYESSVRGGAFNGVSGGGSSASGASHPMSQGNQGAGIVKNRPPLVLTKPEETEGNPLPPTTTVKGGGRANLGNRGGGGGGGGGERKTQESGSGLLYGLSVHLYGKTRNKMAFLYARISLNHFDTNRFYIFLHHALPRRPLLPDHDMRRVR